MAFFDKFFAQNSSDPEALYEKGKAAVLAGHYRDALDDLNQTLKISPGHVNALLERGKALGETKNYKQALADFNKVIALQPANATAYQRRAKVKDFLKDYRGAVQDLDAAIKLQPDFAVALYERALTKIMAMKDKKGAYADLSRAAELGLSIAYDALREFYSE